MLPRRDAASEKRLEQLARSTRPLGLDELVALTGAEPEIEEWIRLYATAHRFEVTGASAARRIVRLTARLGDLEATFGARSARYHHPDLGEFIGREGNLVVPSALRGMVMGVLGFDERPATRPSVWHEDAGATPAHQFLSAGVAEQYALPGDLTGAGETIGIVVPGGGYSDDDLRRFFDKSHARTSARVTRNWVENPYVMPLDTRESLAVSVAVQIVCSVAPRAQVVVYSVRNTTAGMVEAITDAVHSRSAAPSVLLLGSATVEWPDQARAALEQALLDAALRGVTVVAAVDGSGDDRAGRRVLGVGVPGSRAAITLPDEPWRIVHGGRTMHARGATAVAAVRAGVAALLNQHGKRQSAS